MKKLLEEMLGKLHEAKIKDALKQLEYVNSHEDAADSTMKIAAHLAKTKRGANRPEITWFLMKIKNSLIYDKEGSLVSIQVSFKSDDTAVLFMELYKKYGLKYAKQL